MRRNLFSLLILLTTVPATIATSDVKIASKQYVDKSATELNKKVDLESEQTITGTKTFSVSPIVPTPPLPEAL